MEQFFAKVAEIREKMAGMSEGQHELMHLHDESKTAVQADRTRTIREAMARQTEQIKKQAKVVKNDLDFVDALNARALQKPVSSISPDCKCRGMCTKASAKDDCRVIAGNSNKSQQD
jgi:hypothetical protein